MIFCLQVEGPKTGREGRVLICGQHLQYMLTTWQALIHFDVVLLQQRLDAAMPKTFSQNTTRKFSWFKINFYLYDKKEATHPDIFQHIETWHSKENKKFNLVSAVHFRRLLKCTVNNYIKSLLCHQAPVVQTFDSAIQRITQLVSLRLICWIVIYPMGSAT